MDGFGAAGAAGLEGQGMGLLAGGGSPAATPSGNSIEEGGPLGLDSVHGDGASPATSPPSLLLLPQAGGGSSIAVDPSPYVSTQFYTFNAASHHLMAACILQRRYAAAAEVRRVTPRPVLASWKAVWKDRSEDTALLTGWKRIQDKLHARVSRHGDEALFFKSHPRQSVPHLGQWLRIVQCSHGDGAAGLRHLSFRDTLERIKQAWTVGAKFYGIPEAFIRACVESCAICSSPDGSPGLLSSKRRRFEYTESFEVQAKDVPQRLQQLAVKHQVVLCIRQKYVRYKPFLAEVKDYCCHRAGEPNMKRPGCLKRKRYASKRCGCGFRIRAIVPITNYSEKEKTFVYEEEGKAIFKLYAVHSGHEPGPYDGNARVIHRLVGPASLAMDSASYLDVEEAETASFEEKAEVEAREALIQYVHELHSELNSLEKNLSSFSHDTVASLCQDLAAVIQNLRSLEELPIPAGVYRMKEHGDNGILLDPTFEDWREQQNADKNEDAVLDQADDAFGADLVPDSQWQVCNPGSGSKGEALRDKDVKWLDDVKESFPPCRGESIALVHRDSRSCEQGRTDGLDAAESVVAIPPVDNFQEGAKWYEGMPLCGLDPATDCVDGLPYSAREGFGHGRRLNANM